jgi:hypothetical protein
MSSSDGNGAFASAVLGKGFPFITAAGCNGLLTIRVSGVDNTELNKVSSWGLGVVSTVAEKRWWSDVTASYGRDTDDDEVQRSKELIVMGKNEKSSVHNA